MFGDFSLDAFIGDPVLRRKMAENPGNDTVEELRMISPEIVPVSSSIEPAHVAHKIGIIDEQIREFHSYFRHSKEFILPEEHEEEFNSPCGRIVVDTFAEILGDSFEGTENRNARKPVMHIPTISAFYNVLGDAKPGDHILIVTPTAKDIKRLLTVRTRHFPDKILRFTLILDERTQKKIRSDLLDARFASDFDDFLRCQDDIAKYSHIVIPYAMGYVFDEHGRNRYEVATTLRLKLQNGGTIIMLYYDVDALKQISCENKYVSGVEVNVHAELPIGLEGGCVTSVGNDVFRDYRFTPASLRNFAKPEDEMELFSARDYLRSKCRPPPELANNSLDRRLEPIRAVHWVKGVVDLEPCCVDAAYEWPVMRLTERCASATPLFQGVTPNRGRPYCTGDLFFLNPDRIYVTPKADGVEAILAFDHEGVAWIQVRGSERLYTFDHRGPPNLIVQLELIGDYRGVGIFRSSILC